MPDELLTYNGLRVFEVPSLPAGTFRVLPVLPWLVMPLALLPRDERELYVAAGGEIKEPVVIVRDREDARRVLHQMNEARRGS